MAGDEVAAWTECCDGTQYIASCRLRHVLHAATHDLWRCLFERESSF